MRFTNFAIAATAFLSATAVAFPQNNNIDDDLDDISNDDIPNQCRQVCAPVITFTNDCDNRTPDDDDDRQFRDCVCAAPDSQNLLAECEACVRFYDNDDDDDDDFDDNDVWELIRACSFTTRAFNQGQQPTAVPVPAPAPPAGQPTAAASSSVVVVVPVPGNTGAAVSSALVGVNPTRTTTQGPAQQTNANAAAALGPAVGLAGLGLAVAGLL